MRFLPIVFFLLLLFVFSCAAPPVREEIREDGRMRGEIVAEGEAYLGRTDLDGGGHFRNDCSGYVIGLYRSLGYRVELTEYRGSESESLYRNLSARRRIYYRGAPRRADIVFFRNTVYGGGDRVTHVGMVYEVLENGTVVLLHYGSRGVAKLRMNLIHPRTHKAENGEVLNDFLRRKKPGYRGPVLAGELFHCYGDLYGYVTR